MWNSATIIDDRILDITSSRYLMTTREKHDNFSNTGKAYNFYRFPKAYNPPNLIISFMKGGMIKNTKKERVVIINQLATT